MFGNHFLNSFQNFAKNGSVDNNKDNHIHAFLSLSFLATERNRTLSTYLNDILLKTKDTDSKKVIEKVLLDLKNIDKHKNDLFNGINSRLTQLKLIEIFVPNMKKTVHLLVDHKGNDKTFIDHSRLIMNEIKHRLDSSLPKSIKTSWIFSSGIFLFNYQGLKQSILEFLGEDNCINFKSRFSSQIKNFLISILLSIENNKPVDTGDSNTNHFHKTSNAKVGVINDNTEKKKLTPNDQDIFDLPVQEKMGNDISECPYPSTISIVSTITLNDVLEDEDMREFPEDEEEEEYEILYETTEDSSEEYSEHSNHITSSNNNMESPYLKIEDTDYKKRGYKNSINSNKHEVFSQPEMEYFDNSIDSIDEIAHNQEKNKENDEIINNNELEIDEDSESYTVASLDDENIESFSQDNANKYLNTKNQPQNELKESEPVKNKTSNSKPHSEDLSNHLPKKRRIPIKSKEELDKFLLKIGIPSHIKNFDFSSSEWSATVLEEVLVINIKSKNKTCKTLIDIRQFEF